MSFASLTASYDVVERQRDDDGSENLLLHDAHVLPDVREHRRLHEIAALANASAAGRDSGALTDAACDVTANAIALHVGHERPELARRIDAGTELHLRRDRRELGDDAIECLALHVEP